jgi:hypothetical protein
MHDSYIANSNAAKIDEDVVECISNNAKYAHLVKDFNFNFKLRPLRAIEVFETFRFICRLTIGRIDMAQGQFLGMINPLIQLQELTIRGLRIKNVFRKNLYNEVVQLPPSLKKLTLGYVGLIDNPELFIQTINSHSNLVEFSSNSDTNNQFLDPFHKEYPSLLNFEYKNWYLQTSQPLVKTFKSNPQLINLKLSLGGWNDELVNHISNYLINLEQLELSENSYHEIKRDILVKFSQPTKIKKLSLHLNSLTNCSLNSILTNCPHLEELNLNPFKNINNPNWVKFLNFSNPSKLKKLAINGEELDKGVFKSLILNCPHISELKIRLDSEWKEEMRLISKNCANLERLAVCPSDDIYIKKIYDIFCKELYETEFFTSNPKCKSKLTHFTFICFKIHCSKAEYFKNFDNLKSILYPKQLKMGSNSINEEAKIIKDLWPGYKVLLTDINDRYDSELKRY